jgi:hypothetical protein
MQHVRLRENRRTTITCLLIVAIFWNIAPYSSYVNRRFGGTYHLHFQGRKSATCYTLDSCSAIFDPEDGDDTFFSKRRLTYDAVSHKMATF